ncbi:RNA-binding protein Raly-like [Salvelinus sp. IW2-2015]|uniref:RNA-binding protein Raly-like n=1 Tax=Salvelinus sp. IW2-2015 TaxID=2691554 RepID=UPI0038D354A5
MSLKVHTSNVTNKNDPKSINSRVFIGNLNTAAVKKSDVESIFSQYGRVLGCSVHKGYAFVQYASERHARGSVIGENGRVLAGQTLDINMAGEPKPNRPKGLKRSAAGLYSGYDFDNDYYRDEFYDRLFEYRSRVSPVPRIVPVKWPHVAMPLVRQVKYLPAKLLARSSLLPSSTKQKSVKSNELQVIKSELTRIKFNIDALLGRVEQITEDKHFAAELRKAEKSSSEVSQDESCSDTEELVDETHNSDVEDGTPDECEDDDMELKAPPTGVSTKGREATATSWEWYAVIDELLGGCHSINTPVIISSSSLGAAVGCSPFQKGPDVEVGEGECQGGMHYGHFRGHD